jgi:hypothetical protein
VLVLCAVALLSWGGYTLTQSGVAVARSSKAHHSAARRHGQARTSHATHRRPSRSLNVWAVDARYAVKELLGGDGSRVGFGRRLAEWGGTNGPHWWQSALAVLALVQYMERTNSHSQAIQNVLLAIYRRNVRVPGGFVLQYRPGSTRKYYFTNQFMDDTVWWGLAWLKASEYELYYRQNTRLAGEFLKVAEKDASYVAGKRQCGGIIWELGSATGTITNAEYVALTAELAQFRRTSSTFHNPGLALRWLADARGTLKWLQRAGLVNLRTGTVKDRLGNGRCQTIIGGPLAYSEGEMADALVQMGNALNNPGYYRIAARFLRYVLNPAHGFLSHGVLLEHCEASHECDGSFNRYDITAFKGIFVQAVADWAEATGSKKFLPFLRKQGEAVIHRALVSGRRDGRCTSAHSCQFGFSWTLPFSRTPGPERLVTVGTQESALAPLTALAP